MPLFEYRCRDCENPFEMFVTAERTPLCPSCGSRHLEKLLSRLGMVGSSSRAEVVCDAPPSMCGAAGGHCGCQPH